MSDSKRPTPPRIDIPPRTPTANVPPVMIEDPTPVDMPPYQALERRSKQTKENVDQTLTTVSLMRAEFSTKHQALSDGLATVSRRTDELAGDVRQLASKVSELAESNALANGKLDILVQSVQSNQRVIEHHRKVTIETDAVEHRLQKERAATETKIQLEDAADERKFRRQKWLKLFGIVAAIGTALAGGLTALLTKC